MRSRRLIIAATVTAAISGAAAADAAAQATATINAVGNSFAPGTATLTAGGTVRITNTQGAGSHNLYTGATRLAPPGANGNFDYTSPALAAGTYVYYCSLHGTPDGGMRVVVTVNAATPGPTPTPNPTPTPTPTPNPTPTPSPGTDSVAPKVTRVTTSRNLQRAIVRFRLDEDATVTARLRRRGSTRTLKRVTKELDAGTRSLTVRKRLSRGARYTIALRVVDDAGNVTNRTVNFTAPR